jgi:hypothetical protein
VAGAFNPASRELLFALPGGSELGGVPERGLGPLPRRLVGFVVAVVDAGCEPDSS